MFDVYEHLSKYVIVLQLRENGKVVKGFDYQIKVEREKDWSALRKMLLKEASKRNREAHRRANSH